MNENPVSWINTIICPLSYTTMNQLSLHINSTPFSNLVHIRRELSQKLGASKTRGPLDFPSAMTHFSTNFMGANRSVKLGVMESGVLIDLAPLAKG